MAGGPGPAPSPSLQSPSPAASPVRTPRPLSAPSPLRSTYRAPAPQAEVGKPHLGTGVPEVIGFLAAVVVIALCCVWVRRCKGLWKGAARAARVAAAAGHRTVVGQAITVAPPGASTYSHVLVLHVGLPAAAADGEPQSQAQEPAVAAAHKMDEAAIQALPMFKYRRQQSQSGGGGGQLQAGVVPAAVVQGGVPAPVAGLDVDAALAARRHLQSKGGSDGECPVCLGELREGDMVRMLPYCLHLFHPGCIDPWLLEQPSCPICRLPVQAGEPAST